MRRQEALDIIKANEIDLRDLGVRYLAIFGSVARDEATTESDVDLLVEFDRPVGLFAYARLRRHLERLLGRRVDLVTMAALRPEMQERVRAEALRAA